MAECPHCGHEFDIVECPACGGDVDLDDNDVAESMMDPFDGPLDVEDGAEAILKNYCPEFGLGDRLVLEEAIKKCLTEKLGVSVSAFP